MNHVYRLVWNSGCNAYVPAPEFARGRKKKSNGGTLVGAVRRVLSVFLSGYCLLHLGTVLAEPIVPDGRTQTTVTTRGPVTDVHTQTVRGLNAFNSFQRFNVVSGQTANMYLPAGTANLLNLVHGERSYFDGILNAYKDGRIGGNVFFLNPHGIVVGVAGMLNVGSLTLAAPTPQFMDGLIDPSGLISGAAVADVLSGRIALTDSGLIQVKGRINALGSVDLQAGQVAVDAGARLIAGPQAQVAFGDLVNIDGVQVAGGVEVKSGVVKITAARDIAIAGKIAADGVAGVNAGQIDVRSGSDIHLTAGADVTANGQGAASTGGQVRIYADGNATLNAGARIAANGGVSGDGGFVELSARDNVALNGGQMTAEASLGRAGTVLIDPKSISGSGSDYFSATNYVLSASDSITLNDVVISTRNVAAGDSNRTNIDAASSIGDSGSITLTAPNIALNPGTKLYAHATDNFSAGDIALTATQSDHMVGFRAVEANTKIDINGATLKGRNIALTATSDAGYDWTGDPAQIAERAIEDPWLGTLFAGLTGLNIGIARSDAKSEVLVKSDSIIDAQGSGGTRGSLELKSDATSTAQHFKLGLDVLTKRLAATGNLINVGFVWGEANSTATVQIAKDASIIAGTLNLSSINRATTDLTVIGVSKDTTVNAAAVVNKANVQAKASIDAGASIDVDKSISVLAHNQNRFSSGATSMALSSGRVGIAVNYTQLNTGATASNSANLLTANLSNVKIEALNDTVTNKSTAGTSAGSSFIGANVIEPVLGVADSMMDKILGKVEAGPQALDRTAGGGKPKIGAAVTYADNTHEATAYIGAKAQVIAAQEVIVAAKVNDQRIRTHATASAEGKKDDPRNPGVSLGLAGAVSIGLFKHNVDAYVGDNAKVTAKQVGVVSELSIPYGITWWKWEGASTIFSKLNSNLGAGDGFLSGWSNSEVAGCVGVCLAGSVTHMDFDNTSHAYLGRGTEVKIAPGGADTWGAALTGDSSAFVHTNNTDIPATRTQNLASPLHVLAKSAVEGVYVAGNMSILIVGAGGKPGAAVLGGAYNQVKYATSTKAWVSEGALIAPSAATAAPVNVTVETDSRTQIVGVAPSAGAGASYGANMIFAMAKVNDTTESSIDDEARVTGARVDVKAKNDEIVWAFAGAVNKSDSLGVGAGVALNDVTTDTRATLADNDSNNDGGSTLANTDGKVKAGDLAVSARTDGRIEAIAVAGAAAASSDPKEPAGKLDKAKSGLTGLLSEIPDLGSKLGGGATPGPAPAPTSPFGIALAGSSAVNVINLGTRAFVAGATVEMNSGAASAVIGAINDTDITAATGSAALARANNSSSAFSAGIAGSVAVNVIDDTTKAYIKGSTMTGAHDVAVSALAGGEQLAVAIGLAVNASADQNKAASIAGSVSVNHASNTTSAQIENTSAITGPASGAGRNLDVVAYDRLKIGTGGGTLIAGGKGGIGAAVSYSEISNTTEAAIDVSSVNNYDDVQVHALTASKIGAGGGMAGGTWANNGFTLDGAFVISDIGNTTKAEIRNGASVTAASRVDVLGADTKGVAALDTLIDKNDGGSPNASSLDYDATAVGGKAGAGSSIVSVAGVAQLGADNLGMAFAQNKIANKLSAKIDASTVSAGSAGAVNVIAQSNAQMLGLGLGVGVATGKFAGLGSLTLSEIGNTVTAEVHSTSTQAITAATLTVMAKDDSSNQSLAGNVAVGIGNTAIGAAVALSETANTVTATISGADIHAQTSVQLNANNDSISRTLAASAGGADKFAFNGSAADSTIGNTTKALLKDSKLNNPLAAVSVRAQDTSQIDSLSGGAALTIDGAAAGIGVSINKIDNSATAAVEGVAANASYGLKNLVVGAASNKTIRTLAAGAGLGSAFGAGGSTAVNLVGGDTKAYIDNGAVVIAEHNVGVTADSNDNVSVIAGSVAVGVKAAAIGASFSINSIGGDTLAYIEGATTSVTGLAKDPKDVMTVYSGELASGVDLAKQTQPSTYSTLDLKSKRATEAVIGVAVNAASSQHVGSISANAAGGSLALGLVISIDVIGGKTQAYVENSDVNKNNAGAGSGQRVAVTASNVAIGNSFVGNVVLGSAGIDVGEDIHNIFRQTSAYSAGGSIAATGQVGLKAFATQGVSSAAVGGAAGKIAGAGTLSMSLFDNLTEAYGDGTQVSAGALDIQAHNNNDMYLLSGSVSGGGVAVGGAFSVAISASKTTASLMNVSGTSGVDVGGSVNVDAIGATKITHRTVSAAGAGSVAVAGMADVNLITDTTQASIENSLVGAAADKVEKVRVGATHTLDIDSKAGTLAGAGAVGVGAGASVNIVKAQTTATVDSSNLYATGLIDVTAESTKHIDATAVTAGAGGTAGIGAAAVIALVGDDVRDKAKDELDQNGSGTLSAVEGFSNGSRINDLPATALSDSERNELDAATRRSTTAVTGSAGGYTYRTAAEVNGAGTAIQAGSMAVSATDKTDTNIVVGGLGLALSGGGVGGGVAVTSVKSNVAATVSGAALTTNGNVTLRATADKDKGDAAINVTARAGGAGWGAVGAAVSYAGLNNHVEARFAGAVNAGTGTVTVAAEDKTDISSKAQGAAVGAGAAGVVVSYGEKDSIVNASLAGGVIAAGTSISATEQGAVKTLAQSAAGGMAASGAGADAQATDKSTVKASTDAGTMFKLSRNVAVVNGAAVGSLDVTASATPQTEAEADGVNVSGGLSIGGSIANAKAHATVEASLGSGNTVDAGAMTVLAQQLRNGSSESARSTAFAASGGMLIGGSATLSEADALLKVASSVGDNSSLNLGNTASVKATLDSKQYAKASGITGGNVALGFNDANANSDNTVAAALGTGVMLAAQTLDINAGGSDDNFAEAKSGSGGVFAGAAALANTSTKSATSAAIGAGTVGRDIKVGAFKLTADHTSKFNSGADGIQASILGASGAYAHNKVDKAVVTASIGDGATVSADTVDINASNRVRKDESGFNVIAASGGVFDAAATHSDTTVNIDTDVVIGKAVTIKGIGQVTINALNDVQLYDAAKMDSGGAIALAKAESFIYNDQNDADIAVGSGSLLNSKKDVTLESKTLARADTEVQSKTYGLSGAAQGASVSRIGTSNNIVLNGARLESDENVVLRAGYNNVLTADAETRLWNRTVLPIETHPDADGKITQNNKITIAAYVPATGTAPTGATAEDRIARAAIATVKDIYLQTGEGSHTVRGHGRGTDLYRELLADAASLVGADISLDITGGSVADDAVTGVKVDGTLFAGTQHHQFLHIDGNGTIVKQSEGMATPGRRSSVDLARDTQDRIDGLQKLIDEYQKNADANANNSAIIAGFQADIDILNAQKSRLGAGAKANFIDIAPVAAYTGIIFVAGKALSGTGELVAPGDSRIEIVNDSKSFLNIKHADTPSLYIPDDLGGIVSFNGVRVSSTSEIDAVNQRGVKSAFGAILDRQTSIDPMILVQNTYADPVNVNALNPEIHIDGDISNLRGTVKVDSQGTIQVASNIYAKTVDIKTNGDFIQQFTVGFTHTGGDPTFNVPNQIAGQPKEVWRTVRNRVTGAVEYKLVPYTLDYYYEDKARGEHYTSYDDGAGWRYASYSDTPAYDFRPPPSGIIAGHNVFISGQKLNINSLIQSGLPLFNVVISQAKADEARNANGAWIPLAMSEEIGTYLQRVNGPFNTTWDSTITASQTVDPVFQPKIRWQNNQIELQSLAVGGGYMHLYGDIFSTGNGRLKVLDGYGQITVNNASNYNLAVNRLDTGAGVAGMIKITDTSTKDSSGKPLVTTITRVNGMVTATYENLSGTDARTPTASGQTERTAQYNPRTGRRLHWLDSETIAMSRWETYDRECAGSCSFGDLADWLAKNPGNSTGSGHADPQVNPRPNGEWLADDPKSRTNAYILDFSSNRSNTASNGPYKTGGYRSGLGGFNEHITSKKDWWWTQYNYYDHSLYASNPIQVEFSGYDTGSLSVDAGGGNLAINGALRNRTGSTVLKGNSISAASQAIVTAKNLYLDAKAGIGAPSVTPGASTYLKIDLQRDGSLDAQAGGNGIAIWEQDGDLPIARTQSAGIVDLKADRDIYGDVVISGSSIRLTSENGAIYSWTPGFPLEVDITSATGNLKASAAKSIYIRKTEGDLRLDSVTSLAGDVELTADVGSIIDDNKSARVDVEGKAALLAVADRAGLSGGAALVGAQTTVFGYNAAKGQSYARYWQMRNVKTNPDGTYIAADAYDAGYVFHLSDADKVNLKARDLSDRQIAQYEAAQTQLYHKAHQEFGSQPYKAGFSYDVQKQDTATYQQLIAGSTWTDAQIQNRVAAGIFKNTADTKVLIEEANVTGGNVVLTAMRGSIGAEQSEMSISLTNSAAWTDAERLALAAADRKDVAIDSTNKTIKVRMKDDIDVALRTGGTFGADAASDIYIGAETDIRVSSVSASGEVRIKTSGGLTNVSPSSASVDAKDLTIEAGGGDLGTSAAPFGIRNTGTLTARAAGDLFVNNYRGDMRLEQVYATKGATLVSVRGGILENPARYDFLTDIQAAQISLKAATKIGEADATGLKYLDMVSDPLGWVDMTAPAGIYVYVPSRQFNLRSVSASDGSANMSSDRDINVTSLESLNIVGSMSANGKTTLKTGRHVVFSGGSLTSYNGVNLEAGTGGIGSIAVAAESSDNWAIYTYGLLNMKASGSIMIDGRILAGIGATVSAGGDVRFGGGALAGYNGPVTLNAGGSIAIAAGDGATCANESSVTLCGTNVTMTAPNNITVGGRVLAEGATTLKAGMDLQLTGGSLRSYSAVDLAAGAGGYGSMTIGAENAGGYAIDTHSTLDMKAANAVTVYGQIRASNTTIEAGDDLHVKGGKVESSGGLTLRAADDLKLDGSLQSPGLVWLESGSDGSGSIVLAPGHVTDTDGTIVMTTPDGISINTGNIMLRADEAVFDMLAVSARTPTPSRSTHPGHDASVFTLDGGFNLSALKAKALIEISPDWLGTAIVPGSGEREEEER